MRAIRRHVNAIDRAHPFSFALPALVVYCVFFMVPIFLNIGTAFTDWNTYQTRMNFTGLENFRELVRSGDLLLVIKTTFYFTVTVVLLQNLFGFGLALALERKTRANDFFRGLFFVPAVIAIIVWGYLFQTILHPRGLLNNFLSFILRTDVRVAWLGSVRYTIFVVGVVNTWMWTGFSMMIYIAAINSIPEEILEAGRIDGLRFFGMVRHIIIPLVIPGLTVNILISTIGSLKVFDIIMVLTKGGPGQATHVFNTWIYQTFGQGLLGYASAMNILLIALISLVAFPIYIQLSKRVVEA
ncbi:MAG: sugar ABC transporter permease [Spirochaetales bacterium]|nr:sugar ABC transporter permease [Spirochaetales bacterium]